MPCSTGPSNREKNKVNIDNELCSRSVLLVRIHHIEESPVISEHQWHYEEKSWTRAKNNREETNERGSEESRVEFEVSQHFGGGHIARSLFRSCRPLSVQRGRRLTPLQMSIKFQKIKSTVFQYQRKCGNINSTKATNITNSCEINRSATYHWESLKIKQNWCLFFWYTKLLSEGAIFPSEHSYKIVFIQPITLSSGSSSRSIQLFSFILIIDAFWMERNDTRPPPPQIKILKSL